jgi:hypothetical protein
MTSNKKIDNNANYFICELCNYNTCNKKDYNKHLLTKKHQNITNYNENGIKVPELYKCFCGKEYKYRASLFNHKKKCNYKLNGLDNNKSDTSSIIMENDNSIDFKSMFLQVMEKNNELLKTISELNLEYTAKLREFGKSNAILLNTIHSIFKTYGKLPYNLKTLSYYHYFLKLHVFQNIE